MDRPANPMMVVAAVWMIFEEAGRAGAVKAIATLDARSWAKCLWT
jgi:hypothetical protein